MKETDSGEALFKQQLKSGELCGIYVFYGDEDYLKEHSLSQLKKAVIPELDEFSFIETAKDDFDLDRFYEDVSLCPFTSEKKLLVLRNISPAALKESEKKAVMGLLADVPPYTVIVFYFDSMFTSGDYTAKQKRISEIKQLSKVGALLIDFKLREQDELVRWVLRHFKAGGVGASTEIARFLLSYTSNDMSSLKTEIDKLISFTAGRPLTKDDILAITTKSLDAEIFDLTNSIAEGRYNDSFSIIFKLRQLKFSAMSMLSGISSVFAELLYTAAALQKGITDPNRIIADFGISPKRRFLISRYFSRVRNLELGYLCRCVKCCYDCECSMKRSRVDEWLVLEQAVIKLMQR